MKDTPFSLDSLQDVLNLIKANSFMTKLDDKSAYMNMKMTEIRDHCFVFNGADIIFVQTH